MEIVSENGKIDGIALLVNVLDYLNFKDLVLLRTVCKELRPHVTGISFWDKISVLQEKREAKGKRVVLFNQFMMSRENALLLPPSNLYK